MWYHKTGNGHHLEFDLPTLAMRLRQHIGVVRRTEDKGVDHFDPNGIFTIFNSTTGKCVFLLKPVHSKLNTVNSFDTVMLSECGQVAAV